MEDEARPSAGSSARNRSVLAIVSFGVWIAWGIATFRQAERTQQIAVLVLLVLPSIVLGFATSAWLEHRWDAKRFGDHDNHEVFFLVKGWLRPTRASTWLVLAPSVALCLLVIVRLCFVDHFSTAPVALKFGYRYCNEEIPDMALDPGVGHGLQGCLATFLAYPAARGLSARMGRKVLDPPRNWVLVGTECFSFSLTMYNVYNFVKRAMLGPTVFAASSYFSNGCEWALGAILGISLGMLVTSLTKEELTQELLRRMGNPSPSSSDEGSPHSFAEIEPPLGPPLGCLFTLLLGVAKLIAVLFWVSLVAVIVLTSVTWNGCDETSA